MEDASGSSTSSAAAAAAAAAETGAVGVTLFPRAYEPVEVITEAGEEILQQEFSDAQLFVHAIQELEKARHERRKPKKQKTSGGGGGSLSPAEKQPARSAGEKSDEPMPDASENDDAQLEQEGGDGDGDAAAAAPAGHEDDDEEDVIDPRVHYQPMVLELQAAVAELHQLVNSIDLIRRREFMEEMRCLRENTAPKREDLEFLLESKTTQVRESSSILLAGVDNLARTVATESVFFQGVTRLLRKWKICAPIHGNIPKPFRAGEPLAVDCSFISAGSIFAPPTRSIADLSFAELSRTDKGLVRVKAPEEFLPRTVQLQLLAVESGKSGSYTLPWLTIVKLTRSELDALENTPEDLKTLDERNASVLKAVQFSVFCEELFQTLMHEALRSSSNWTDTAYSISNYASKRQRAAESADAGGISVLQVLDDEIQLRVNEKYHLAVKLVDASAPAERHGDALETEAAAEVSVKAEAHHDANGRAHAASAGLESTSDAGLSEEEFLSATCRYSLLLLQQEIRHRHGRKELARSLLFTGSDTPAGTSAGASGHQPEGDKPDATTGTLSTVLAVIAHNLLKEEVARYLDAVSAALAFQKMQASASGRVLEDGLPQPICDSVRGVYLSPRWKACAFDSTLSAFDLSIGKSFTTEVLLAGTRIRFEDGPASVREVSGLAGLREFVEKTVCTQVALALHRDVLSFGLKQAAMDLDRASVRIFSAREWDGTCVGDGRVSDAKAVGSIYLEPFFEPGGSLAISCMLQAVSAANVAALATLAKSASGGDVHAVDWKRIPGQSDVAKLAWLLQQTGVLSRALAGGGGGDAAASSS